MIWMVQEESGVRMGVRFSQGVAPPGLTEYIEAEVPSTVIESTTRSVNPIFVIVTVWSKDSFNNTDSKLIVSG